MLLALLFLFLLPLLLFLGHLLRRESLGFNLQASALSLLGIFGLGGGKEKRQCLLHLAPEALCFLWTSERGIGLES